jgi:hypothetical protein
MIAKETFFPFAKVMEMFILYSLPEDAIGGP